jgi:hypothetical protein
MAQLAPEAEPVPPLLSVPPLLKGRMESFSLKRVEPVQMAAQN